MSDRRVAVIGVGNVLCQDEGVGVHAAHALQTCGLAPGVEVIDAGTAVLDVLLDNAGCHKIVVVDAVSAGGEPGDIYRLPLAELDCKDETAGISLHEVSLLGSLELASLQQPMPEVVIIGVEPGVTGTGMNLSARVRERLDTVLATVLKEAAR